MAEAALKLTTVDEFLRWDDHSDRRYQLIRGAIVMMAPPTRRHGTLLRPVSPGALATDCAPRVR